MRLLKNLVCKGERKLFSEELIYMDILCENQRDLFKTIAEDLLKKGYVQETYLQAITEREKTFPTGITTNVTGVAIPHTDSKHIKNQGIAIVRLRNPISFCEMVTNETIKVKLAFFLLVNDKEKQVPVIKELMRLFADDHFLNDMLDAKNTEELFQVILNNTSN